MVQVKGRDEPAVDDSDRGQFFSPHSADRLKQHVSMRMILLFILLRRSGSMAQKRLFNLSENQWRIMTQLGTFAPLSLNGLAERLVQDRGQVSRAVKGLVERGLVAQTRKPGGPELDICLSPEGDALHERMVEWVIERDKKLTDGMDPDELAIARDVVERMIVQARTMVDQERELTQK